MWTGRAQQGRLCKLSRTEIRIRWAAWSRDEIIFQNPSGQLGIFSLGLSYTVGRCQRPWRGDRRRYREPEWWGQDLQLKETYVVLEMGKPSGLVTSTGGLAPGARTICFISLVCTEREENGRRGDGRQRGKEAHSSQ